MEKNIKILLVEDNPSDARLIREYLKESSKIRFEIAECGTLSNISGKLQNSVFDIVMTDLNLPDSSGLDTFREVKTANPGLPIIVLTGLDDDKTGEEAVNLGAEDYLVKGSFTDKELVKSILYAIDRNRIKEKLAKANHSTTSILASISDGFFAADKNFNLTFINERVRNYLALGESNLLGKNIFEIFPAAKGTIFEEKFTEALLLQCPLNFEAYFDAPGFEAWYYTRVYPFDGGISVYIQNITEKKAAEQRIYESEDRFRHIFENMVHGVIFQDKNGYIINANPAAEKILGLTLGEMTRMTSKDPAWRAIREDGSPFPGEEHPSMTALKTGKPVFNVLMGVFNNSLNEYRWILINAVPRFFNGGDTPDQVHTTFNDITVQKKTEFALKESERFAKATLNALSKNIAVLNEKGTIIAANDSWKKFANENGLDPFEASEGVNYLRVCDEASGPFSEEARDFAAGIRAVLSRESDIYTLEYPCHSPSANRWFVGKVTRFAGEGPVRAVVTHENITDKKLYETGLIEAKEKAEEVNRLKSVFLANMSHELRTPLVGILGYTELMQDEVAEKGHREMLASINESGRRLLRTLNAIMEFSVIESEKTVFELKKLNIIPLVQNATSDFINSNNTKGISIKFECSQNEILCMVEPEKMVSIINNLLDNAVKFTDEGSITVNVSLIKDDAIISVTDTGMGIPANQKERIFQEFRQVSEGFSRSHEGTGLGLTLVRKYTELMHGKVTVESMIGKGSTFNLVIPVYKEEAHSSVNRATGSQRPQNETTSDNKTVLVVDDEPSILRVVQIGLRNEFSVETASNAEEAMEKINAKRFDRILLDINLGKGPNGIGVMKQIKQIPDYKDVPVIAFTAYALPEDKKQIMEAGFDGYLSKPFRRQELLEILANITQA